MSTSYPKPWPPPKEQALERLRWTPKEISEPLASRAPAAHPEPGSIGHAAPALRSLLAITDLGDESDSLLRAAAQLAMRHGIALHLAYHCKKPQHGYTHPIDRLTQRARHLSRHHPMRVEVRIKRELSAHDLASLAPEFDLVVMHRDQLLRTDFLGASPLARLLLDQARVRVLAYVSIPPSANEQALVASGHESGVPAQMSALDLLGRHERIELLHVIDRAEFSELNEEEIHKGVFQHSLRQHWVEVCHRFEDAVSALAPAAQGKVDLTLAHGDVRSEILKRLQHQAMSVLVLGWHRRHRLVAWVRDRFVLRLLREAPCPVLLVPLPRPARRDTRTV